MNTRTPPPGDVAHSRASSRPPIAPRSMDIDREAQEYHSQLQNFWREKGYTAKFPGQTVLEDIRNQYRHLSVDWPEDDDGVICPSPPKRFKQEVLDRARMEELDQHVRRFPPDFLMQPLFDLVHYLVEKAETELEETFTLYRWLTSQVLNTVVTQNGRINVPDDYTIIYLQRLKKMSITYADMFAEMVRYASIDCVKVTGQMKVYPKQASDPLTKITKHAWCAVFVGREWRLVDCFLGAKISHDIQNDISIFDEKCSIFYFIPDPEQFILTHFPDRDYWQLLPRFVSWEEFKRYPYFTHQFHCLGLQSSHDRETIDTHNGQCNLALTFPAASRMAFSYRLRKVTSRGQSPHDTSLSNNVFLETCLSDRSANFSVALSEKGQYVLDTYGKSASLYMEDQVHLCSYGITCTKIRQGFHGYPCNDRQEWGPGSDLESMGIVPVTHTAGSVETKGGAADVVFKVPDNLMFFQEVTDASGKENVPCAVHRKRKDEVMFSARPPKPGNYNLKIFAKDRNSDKEFKNVCNYLLRCPDSNESDFDIPQIPYGRVGHRSSLQRLGLTVVPNDSIICAPPVGQLKMKVNLTKAVTLLPELTHFQDGKEEDATAFVSSRMNKERVTFTFKLPKHGMYNFVLHGKQADEGFSTVLRTDQNDERVTEGLKVLHNTLIACHWPYKDCTEFPKTLAGWGKGCRLFCPQRKYLPAGSVLKFKLIVPDADDVAVLDGEQWQHLQRGDGDIWEGDIVLDEHQAGSAVMVKGRVGGEYQPLLQYQVLSQADYVSLQETRKENVKRAAERIQNLKTAGKWRDPSVWTDVAGDSDDDDDDDNISLKLLDEESEEETEISETKRESSASSSSSLQTSSVSSHETLSDTSGLTLTEEEVKKETEDKGQQSSAKIKEFQTDNGSTSTEEVQSNRTTTSDGETTTEGSDLEHDDDSDREKTAAESDQNGKPVQRPDGRQDNANEKSSTTKTIKQIPTVKSMKGLLGENEVTSAVTNGKDVQATHHRSDIKVNDSRDKPKDNVTQGTRKLTNEVIPEAGESSSDDSDIALHGDEQESDSEIEHWRKTIRAQEHLEEQTTIKKFSLPVRLLLNRLHGAVQRRDQEELRSAMSEYQNRELSTARIEFQQARRMLSLLNLREEIGDSMQQNDLDRLQIKIGDAERRGFTSEMQHEISQARAKLKAADRVHKLQTQAINTIIDVPTLSEIIRYVKPPPLVHHVVMAMLLLMRHNEGKTKRWRKSHSRCVMIGSVKLYQKVHQLKLDEINPSIAARARQIIEMYAPDEAVVVSTGVGALYRWVQRVVDEVLGYHDDGKEPIKPANISRQKTIFNDIKPRQKSMLNMKVKGTSLAAIKRRYKEITKSKSKAIQKH